MNTKVLAIALTAVLAVGLGSVYAQSEPVTVSTDKESYMRGETIVVTGTVLQLFGQPVAIQIIDPLNTVVAVDQVEVSPDKTFTAEFAAAGSFKQNGEYTAKVIYVSPEKSATSLFQIGGIIAPSDDTTFELEGFPIGYEITGGRLLSITPIEASNSIEIKIVTTSSGTLNIDFPRNIIDSRMGDDGCSGDDNSFFVLVDGEEIEFEEAVTSESRKLTITFSNGSETIEIIGTCVIPEFGAVAVLVLAVAIVSIIAVSRGRLALRY